MHCRTPSPQVRTLLRRHPPLLARLLTEVLTMPQTLVLPGAPLQILPGLSSPPLVREEPCISHNPLAHLLQTRKKQSKNRTFEHVPPGLRDAFVLMRSPLVMRVALSFSVHVDHVQIHMHMRNLQQKHLRPTNSVRNGVSRRKVKIFAATSLTLQQYGSRKSCPQS